MPSVIPVFPLAGALLLPSGQLPLTIFEPRYLAMVDRALAGDRLIGMIQPRPGAKKAARPPLCAVGCAGRITSIAETGDNRYALTLTGVARYRPVAELEANGEPFRRFEVDWSEFAADFAGQGGENEVDRAALLAAFRAYLQANDLDANWETVNEMSTDILVNALSMLSPYGPAEKQALLEAPDLKTRAATLVAITEMSLARAASPNAVQ